MSIDFDDPEDLHAILSSLAYSKEDPATLTAKLQNEYLYENWQIDPELSNEFSIVAFNDDKKSVIHAVRGTDPKTKDLVTDMFIVGNMFEQYSPYIGGIVGLSPSLERIFKPLSKEMGKEMAEMAAIDPTELGEIIMKNVPEAAYDKMRRDLFQIGIETDEQFNQIMAEQFLKKGPAFFRKQLPTADFFQGSFNKDIRQRAIRGAKFAGGIYGLGKLLQYAGTREPEGERLNREYSKHEKIKEKYADYSRSMTGHSLGGGISLHMSRTLGIPTYAFNPAPQLAHRDKPHLDSKIVRTLLDPVSLLSSSFAEPEKVKVVRTKHFDVHSMDNFIPPKIARRTIVPKVERQKAFFDSNKVAEIKDFDSPPKKCLENPELPECKSYYYI